MPRVGTVTLFFTDVVRSTELLEEFGNDAADELRREHFRMVRNGLSEHDGREVKTLGDGVMAAFASVVDALDCAIRIQRAVRTRNAATVGPQLDVRIGVNVGEAVVEENDYFGRPVIVAKRLCDAAAGGQILVSDLVETMVDRHGAFVFRDLGWVALKGLAVPVPIREVMWTEATPAGPALPVSALPPLRRPASEPGPPHAPSKKRISGLLVAAVLAGALVAGVAIRLRSEEERAPASGINATDDEDVPDEATDLEGGEVMRLRWRKVGSVIGGVGDQEVYRITRGGPGVVAVGYDRSGGERDAAVWTSDNASDWTRSMPTDPTFDAPGDQTMLGVASSGGGLVGVGSDDSAGTTDAAVWYSDDGLTWARAGDRLRGEPGRQRMNRVARVGPVWLAVGLTRLDGNSEGAVWVSRNGLRWPSAGQGAVLGGPGDQEILGIAPGESEIVVVGSDTALGDRDAAVWMSDDGLRWERVDPSQFEAPGDQAMTAVRYLDGRFLAIGSDRPRTGRNGALWVSQDGLDWRRVSQAFGGPAGQEISSLTRFHDVYFALGRDGLKGAQDGAVWLSSDGEHWQRVHGPERLFGANGAQALSGAVVFKEFLVAVGSDGSGGDLDASFWLARRRDTPRSSEPEATSASVEPTP